ncbi:MAG: hypothetical protein WCO52_04430 [bacterium]
MYLEEYVPGFDSGHLRYLPYLLDQLLGLWPTSDPNEMQARGVIEAGTANVRLNTDLQTGCIELGSGGDLLFESYQYHDMHGHCEDTIVFGNGLSFQHRRMLPAEDVEVQVITLTFQQKGGLATGCLSWHLLRDPLGVLKEIQSRNDVLIEQAGYYWSSSRCDELPRGMGEEIDALFRQLNRLPDPMLRYLMPIPGYQIVPLDPFRVEQLLAGKVQLGWMGSMEVAISVEDGIVFLEVEGKPSLDEVPEGMITFLATLLDYDDNELEKILVHESYSGRIDLSSRLPVEVAHGLRDEFRTCIANLDEMQVGLAAVSSHLQSLIDRGKEEFGLGHM